MINNKPIKNPCNNHVLKIQIDIRNQRANLNEINIEDISRNTIHLNQTTSHNPTINYPLTSVDQTSEKFTKITDPIVTNSINKENRTQTSYNKEFILHTFRKPKRFFAVNKNQFNIENKVLSSRTYQPISSFETKLSRELQRVSHLHKNIDSRQLFYQNKTLNSFWKLMPNFDTYRSVKTIENRFAGAKFKSKLKPLGYRSKDGLNQLARFFYNNKFRFLKKESVITEETANPLD